MFLATALAAQAWRAALCLPNNCTAVPGYVTPSLFVCVHDVLSVSGKAQIKRNRN